MLNKLNTLPAGFFEASPTTLHEILPGPTTEGESHGLANGDMG